MTTMRTLLLSFGLASAALADEVVLKNGSAFSGIVREEGERVGCTGDGGPSGATVGGVGGTICAAAAAGRM